jgi:hypothetical protein
MRPHSQRTTSKPKQKHYLQTKFKARTQDSQMMHHNATLSDKIARQQPINTRHNHTECSLHEGEFRKTATELSRNNFSHHNATLCLCQECLCGRHMCKMNVIKPDLTKKSVYQQSFHPQKASPCLVVHA